MPTWLYDAGPNGLYVFLVVTLVMGGTAAFVSGRVVAASWQPYWLVPLYMAMLAAAVRFIHFAIFEEVLLAPQNYLVDLVALIAIATTGFHLMRARQMAEQYGWLPSGRQGG